jgi:hypothetical protein
MDSLVYKKFDFKKRRILEKLKQDIQNFEEELAGKHSLYSSYHITQTFNLLKKSAEEILQSLLDTYQEVGKETGEEIIITHENEILNEVSVLAVDEANRVVNQTRGLAKQLKGNNPPEIDSFGTNFHADARDKAEILIETTKRRIKNSAPQKSFTDEVFVIMQIGNPLMDEIWKTVYMPVIHDFKLTPKRIDKHNEGRFLMSEVAVLINRSKIIIADLTNERPNCYLEVGYTLGTEKYNHLILCAKEDHNLESPNYQKGGAKVHFDITGYDILFWDENKIDDFKLGLAKKIRYRLTLI